MFSTLTVGAAKPMAADASGVLALYWRSEHGLHMNWVVISDILTDASRASVMTEAYKTLVEHEAMGRQELLEGKLDIPDGGVLAAAGTDELIAISDKIMEACARLETIHRPWIEENAIVVSLPKGTHEEYKATLGALNAALMAIPPAT